MKIQCIDWELFEAKSPGCRLCITEPMLESVLRRFLIEILSKQTEINHRSRLISIPINLFRLILNEWTDKLALVRLCEDLCDKKLDDRSCSSIEVGHKALSVGF